MRARFRVLPDDADLAALSIERFTAVLETILVFSTFYLIQQWFAARGFFEQAIERPGSVGTITTHPGWVIATLLGLIALPIFIRRVTDGWKLNDFGFIRRPGRRDLTLAAFLGVVLGLWFAVGFWLRSAALEDARSLLAIRNWYDAAFYVGYVALLASAFRNEFFFRGYVQRLLTEQYGIPWGSFLALLFFWASLSWIGLNHVLVLMVPLGIVSALLFNRRGSLYGPLLCHALAFGLGFIGYALLELTPGGYAWYTAALTLIVVVGLRWMRVPMLVLWRDLKAMVVGLKSKWLRNGATAIVMIAVLKVLWWTAHRDLFAHTSFTIVFALVFIGYKTRKRRFELRRVLEP